MNRINHKDKQAPTKSIITIILKTCNKNKSHTLIIIIIIDKRAQSTE